jgi:MOSC domain-containing protein YiiM
VAGATRRLVSVNVGRPVTTEWHGRSVTTAIRKAPVDGPRHVAGINVDGDDQADRRVHGGPTKAVYAYAVEDYAWWSAELGRDLANGLFGENLTTQGLDLRNALIGERWQVGEQVILEITFGRIPCSTFQHRMAEPRWIKRFSASNRTGAYLRILQEGEISPGDRIEVLERPGHSLTVAEAFNIYMHAPENLARLLVAEALPPQMRTEIEKRLANSAG